MLKTSRQKIQEVLAEPETKAYMAKRKKEVDMEVEIARQEGEVSAMCNQLNNLAYEVHKSMSNSEYIELLKKAFVLATKIMVKQNEIITLLKK